MNDRDEYGEDVEEFPSSLPSGVEIDEPERDMDLGEYASPQTLAEAEEEAQPKDAIQMALRMLTPRFSDKELDNILQPAMVSRIMADNFWDKHKLIVLRELQRRQPTEKIDIIGIISMSQDALSIGFEGRGIADRLEIVGVAHEEEMEKLAKEIGV